MKICDICVKLFFKRIGVVFFLICISLLFIERMFYRGFVSFGFVYLFVVIEYSAGDFGIN